MSIHKIILKDSASETEFCLPVTPESFSVSHGVSVEKVKLHGAGEVNLWGEGTLAEIKLAFLLPASERGYAFSGGFTGNPYGAVELLQNWIDSKKILRFIVSDTPVNLPVMPSQLSYGEKDGTGDVYAELTLKEHKALTAVRTESGVPERESESGGVRPNGDQSYTVVKGDTMWAIAKKFYGDPQKCWALASYNGIKNANLIFPGQVIKIPDKGALT